MKIGILTFHSQLNYGGVLQCWAKQFGIEDFEALLTAENRKGREARVGVMRELIDFITERGYRPIWVLPPVTRHLGKFFTTKFR